MKRLLNALISGGGGRFHGVPLLKFVHPILSLLVLCALLTPGFAATPIDQVQTIPAGTVIPVRMIDSISSDYNEAGQTFRASVAAPVRVRNHVVIPKGATAYVRLVDVDSAGKIKGRSELALRLDRVVTPGKTYVLQSDTVLFRGHSQSKKTAKSAGIGAAIGGGLGALLGGGSGAAVGAGLGAGAGVASRAVKGGRPVRVNSETLVNFRVSQQVR
jgi:hypothetical protein